MDIIQQKLRKALFDRQSGILVTVVAASGSVPREAGSKMLVFADGAITGTIGGGKMESLVITKALEQLKIGQPLLEEYDLYETSPKSFGAICGGSVTLFMEPILRPPTLIIAGAGHVGRALARAASILDMHVVVIDDRPEWADSEQIPWADEVLVGNIPEMVNDYAIDESTCIAAVTRAPAIDEEIIFNIIDKPWKYLGMIGSKRKVDIVFGNLKNRGIEESLLQKIYAPLGIDINAETPEEIAISILSEILQVRNGGSLQHKSRI